MNVQKYYNIYRPNDNIRNIFASSSPNMTSFATVNYGSLLICKRYGESLWGKKK
jgi:hypothetical protein